MSDTQAPTISDDTPELTTIEREKLVTEIIRWKFDSRPNDYPDHELRQDCLNVIDMSIEELFNLYEAQMVDCFLPRTETHERYADENGFMPDLEDILNNELDLLLHPEKSPKHGHVQPVVPIRIITDDEERDAAWNEYLDKYGVEPETMTGVDDPHRVNTGDSITP